MSDGIKDKLNSSLENAEILEHEEISPGVHSMDIKVGEGGYPAKELAYLTGENGETNPLKYHAGGRVISRDILRRVDVDILADAGDPQRVSPQKLYQRAIAYYNTKGQYGTVIDVLTNFAAKGFKNDIDDPDIKLFYDVWAREVGFHETVEKVFFDFFRVGLVRTFKMVGKLEPKLQPDNFTKIVKNRANANSFDTDPQLKEFMAYRDFAAAKKIWSKSFVPLKYTILDPRLLEIKGSTLFDQTETFIKPEAFNELRELTRNSSVQTTEQKQFIRQLPKELIESVKANKPVKLPPELVGKCDYRKQDYERYPRPRMSRAWDYLNYKDALIKADLSTLDGITNYILKITIGNDEHPVTNQEDLETVAKLFDTSSKSFDVVWNHTLKIEKVTFPEISDILGDEKFREVDSDLLQTFGVSRALLDGTVQGNAKAIEASLKSFSEEISYARRCVKRWIDKEYEEIALAMGFNRFPNVRFDENSLKDEIMLMSVIQGMIDRRIISYETGIEKLGMDFGNELTNMRQEAPLVQAGIFGIIGSPYQSTKALPPTETPVTTDTTDDSTKTVVTRQDLTDFQKNIEHMIQKGIKPPQSNIQPNQRTPKGSPSEGRPRRGGRGKPRQNSTTPNIKPRKPTKNS